MESMEKLIDGNAPENMVNKDKNDAPGNSKQENAMAVQIKMETILILVLKGKIIQSPHNCDSNN